MKYKPDQLVQEILGVTKGGEFEKELRKLWKEYGLPNSTVKEKNVVNEMIDYAETCFEKQRDLK